MNLFIYLVSCLIFENTIQVIGHSWMSCPPSFNTFPQRGGHLQPVCEGGSDRAPITKVKAGDRLKIGWTSNNHGGGFVRISLVPEGEHNDENISIKNVLKYVCYGHDTREGRTRFGDCKHPCDARGGCDYPKEVEDKERFDTTIGIPTNLKDGFYIIQTAMLVGNGFSPYYSCGKLEITGGNPNFNNCESDEDPITYDCLKSGGPHIIGHFLHSGARRGNFCFHQDGTRGTVDDNYSQPPVNRNCDPRITCANSVLSTSACEADAPSMADIKFDAITNEPIQENCPTIEIQSTPATSITSTELPEMTSTITTEENGSTMENTTPTGETRSTIESSTRFTTTTTTTAFTTTLSSTPDDLSYYERVSIHGFYVTKYAAVLTVRLHFKKTVPKDFCWELFLQFANPFGLRPNDAYNVWFDGMLVERTNRRVVTIQQRPFAKQATPNAQVFVGMHMFSEDRSILWTKENMKFITAMVEILPKSQCRTRPLDGF